MMAVYAKPLGIKMVHTYVEDLCTGEKREILFKERPPDGSRCFFAEKFSVNKDGGLIDHEKSRDINHERIQLRLDWANNPKKRTGEGDPTLDTDFFAYDAKTQKEEMITRRTREQEESHHTEAENKGGKRIYTWRYKNCCAVIKVAIEWDISIEDKVHLTDSSV